MKNWNIYFLGAIILIIYFGSGLVDDIKQGQKVIKDEIFKSRADMAAIMTKLGADEKEKALFYKLQKNQDVWQGTGCAQCHTNLQLALPITKITITEAMQIVREGNERTKAGGMPTYSARGTRDRNSMTDADLKVRLDALYVKELLDFVEAPNSNHQNGSQNNQVSQILNR